jgi:hypothetical protein
MKRIALLAVIGAGLLALPSTAAAQTSNCPSPPNVDVEITVAPPSARVCVVVPPAGNAGGELVINPAGCSYINGWVTNPAPARGYAGICTNAVSRGPACNPDGQPTGANTGGCLGVDGNPGGVNAVLNSPPVAAVTAMFICGSTSGENPQSTTRRGCSIP